MPVDESPGNASASPAGSPSTSRQLLITFLLLLASWAAASYSIIALFMPMIAVVQQMSDDGRHFAHVTTSPWSNITIILIVLAVMLSVLTTIRAARGVMRRQTPTWAWVLVLLLACGTLFSVAGFAYAAPKFLELMRHLH